MKKNIATIIPIPIAKTRSNRTVMINVTRSIAMSLFVDLRRPFERTPFTHVIREITIKIAAIAVIGINLARGMNISMIRSIVKECTIPQLECVRRF